MEENEQILYNKDGKPTYLSVGQVRKNMDSFWILMKRQSRLEENPNLIEAGSSAGDFLHSCNCYEKMPDEIKLDTDRFKINEEIRKKCLEYLSIK